MHTKKKSFLAALFFSLTAAFLSTPLFGNTIAAWEMFSLDGKGGRPGPNVAEWAACDLHDDIATAVVARGAGLLGTTGLNNTFNWRNSNQNTLAAAINNNNYVSITLTAKSGRHISVDRLQFWISVSGLANGREFALLSSATGFTTNDVLWSVVPTKAKAQYNVDLVRENIREQSSIEFRLYSFGSTNQYDPSGIGIDSLSTFSGGDFHILVYGDTGGGDPYSVEITNLKAVARAGTRIVDVTYDVSSALTPTVKVSLKAHNGFTEIPVTDTSGDIGKGIATGTNRSLVWNVDTDYQGGLDDLFISLRAENDIQPNLLKTGDDYPYFGPYTDGALQIGMDPIEPRFITETHGDHTVVKDMMTGLMWVQNPDELAGNENPMPWEDAIYFCNDLQYAGFDDWRLPNTYEMRSIYLESSANAWSARVHPVFETGFDKYESGGLDTFFGFYTSTKSQNYGLEADKELPTVFNSRNGLIARVPTEWHYRSFPVRTIPDYDPPYKVHKTGQTVSYIVGDDGYYQYGAVPPEPRFETIVTERGTLVLDHLTNLEWMQDLTAHPLMRWELMTSTQYNAVSMFQKQLAMTPHLLYAGRNGWHVANYFELTSIEDNTRNSKVWFFKDVFRSDYHLDSTKKVPSSLNVSSLFYRRTHHPKGRYYLPFDVSGSIDNTSSHTQWFVRVKDWADDTAHTVVEYTQPYIAAEPQDVILKTGTAGTLSVHGYPSDFTQTLAYQWYLGTAPDTSQPLSGATSASYTVPDTLPAGTHTYFVALTDVLGTSYSRTVTVTVIDDFAPPTTITDLSILRTTTSTAELRWTAPSDAITDVVAYEVRYHTEPITEGNFASAKIYPLVPAPLAQGTEQSVVVRSLDEGTPYYFAIKSRDTVGNVSLLSNVPQTETHTPFFVAYHTLNNWDPTDPSPELTSTGGIADLKSYYHGGMPAWGAQFKMIYAGGGGAAGNAPAFAEGTDHHRLFAGFLGNNGLWNDWADSPHETPYYVFQNLPPGIYDITVSIANQGNGGQDKNVFTLEDATGYVQASSVGTMQWDDGNPATTVLPSDNASTGYVARWSGITPTGDGGTSFTLRVSAHTENDSFIFRPRWVRISMVATLPMVVHQPQAATVPAGQSASLSVEGHASQGELSYQWYRGESGDISQPIAGATTASIETPLLPDEGTFPFWVRITDASGSVDSATVLVTVMPNTMPTAVADLEITGNSSNTILLKWTTPEIATGYVAPHAFDIRVSTSPITAENFEQATAVGNLPLAGTAGTVHQASAKGLTPGQRYFLAMRTVAESGVTGLVTDTELEVRLPFEVWSAYHNTVLATANPNEALVSKGGEVNTTYTLKNYDDSGSALPVTLTIGATYPNEYPAEIERTAALDVAAMVMPDAGTDAHALFSGKLDIQNYNRWYSDPYTEPSQWERYFIFTFEGLEPGALYDLAITLNPTRTGTTPNVYMHLEEVDAFAPATSVEASSNTIYTDLGGFGNRVGITANNKTSGGVARWSSIAANGNGGTRLKVIARGNGSMKYVPQLIRLSKLSFDMVFIQTPQNAHVPIGESATLTVNAESQHQPITYEWFAGETGEEYESVGYGTSLTLSNLTLGEHRYWVKATDANSAVLSSDTAVLTVYVPDTVAPDTITDLSASDVLGTSLTLNWTAPDDNDTGVASYEVRYSTSPITDDTAFASATLVANPPAPATAGTPQSVTVSGLSQDTFYYFAIKSTDAVGNVSLISNVLGIRTQGAPTSVGTAGDFNSGAPANLPGTTGLASTTLGWHGNPSSGSSGNYVRHLEAGGNTDGYLQLARNWCNTNRQAVVIWIDPADYSLIAGKTYFLQFDYQVNRTGTGAAYRSDAMVRYAMGDNNGSYSQASALDNATTATISGDGNVFFNFAQTEFNTPSETPWTTHTSQLGFTYTDHGAATRIVIVINGQGFGQHVSTFDPLNHYTYLGIDNVRLLVAPDQPAPLPQIMTQPASVVIEENESVTLTVLASTSGGALSYQWYEGTVGTTTTPVGTNSASFTTPALTATTSYWVRVTDGNGSVDSDTATITVEGAPATTTFAGWIADSGLTGNDALDLADPDADGIVNLLEYAFDLDPNANDNIGLPTVATEHDGGTDYLTLTYRKNLDAPDLTYTIETSTTLAADSWTPATVESDTVVTADPDGDGSSELRKARVALSGEKLFLRVKITQ